MSRHTLVATVRPVAVHTDSHGRYVEINCPYCSERHRHRWPADTDSPGRRKAPCNGRSGYAYIITTPGEPT